MGDGGVVLRPHSSFIPKVPTLSNLEKVVEFTPYGINEDGSQSPEHALCVCRALKVYVESTKANRRSDQLFVTYKRGDKGRAASKQSPASWFKTAIAKSFESQGKPLEKGIRSLKAH